MKEPITVAQLRAFVAVADTLHFGRAAERIGVTQSVVSEEVRRLERSLGLVLFERSTRTVTPTSAVAGLLPGAREALASVDGFARVARRVAGRPDIVTVAASPSVVDGLAQVLVALAGELATVDLRVLPVETGEVAAALEAGEADVGLGRYVDVPRAAYRSRRIADDELWVVVAATRDPGGPIDLTSLGDVPLLLWPRERNRRYFDRIIDVCVAAGIDPMVVVSSPRVVGKGRSPVALGRAFTVVPDRSAAAVERGAIARPIEPRATVPLTVVWRADEARESVLTVVRLCGAAAHSTGASSGDRVDVVGRG